MNEYKVLFEQIKRKDPQTYEIILKRYIEKLERLCKEKNKVFIVSVLNDFRSDNMRSKFPDVYEKYENTHFLSRNLTEEDMEYILKRYEEAIKKIYEEVCHV